MTGTVENSAPQVITDLRYDALQFTFVNDSGADLTDGQEVTLKSTGLIDKRDAGTEFPLGLVIKGAKNGEKATVRTSFTACVTGIAIGGTINANAFVKPNGVKDSEGYPQYVAAAAGDYASGLVLSGGTASSKIRIGIFNSPYQINPAP